MDAVFTAVNKHTSPGPNITNADVDAYSGFFETRDGEQFVYIYDKNTERGVLKVGADGWDREFEVLAGNVSEIELPIVVRFWLGACWQQSTEHKAEPIPPPEDFI